MKCRIRGEKLSLNFQITCWNFYLQSCFLSPGREYLYTRSVKIIKKSILIVFKPIQIYLKHHNNSLKVEGTWVGIKMQKSENCITRWIGTRHFLFHIPLEKMLELMSIIRRLVSVWLFSWNLALFPLNLPIWFLIPQFV